MFDLSGKVAVITGSSKGIGKSIATEMARQGANVVISSRKAPACEEVAAEINKMGKGKAIAVPANISEKAQLERLVAETRKQLGPIDIVVCNAASNPYYGPTEDMPDEAFDKIMRNNILSNIWLIKMALPDMRAKKDGAIIIISSIGGLRGTPIIGAYGISKAADMQLTRSLAVEWSPKNVRVNCVAPGLVKTDFARALWEDPDRLKRTVSTAPLRRIGEPEEIGGVVAFLASKAASFMTGTVIIADGGSTIA
jgi:NAD(P)-dependent dehydrogenase (short-subunit alcohol dehydrogenase family)